MAYVVKEFRNIRKKETFFTNGDCNGCEAETEKGRYNAYRKRKDSLSIPQRLEEIEDWIYRHHDVGAYNHEYLKDS